VLDQGDAIGRGISAATAAPSHGGGGAAAGGKLVGIEKAVDDFLTVGGAVVQGFDLGIDPGLAGGGLAKAATETMLVDGGEAGAGFFCGFWGCGGAGHIGPPGESAPQAGRLNKIGKSGAAPNIYLTRYIVIVQFCKEIIYGF